MTEETSRSSARDIEAKPLDRAWVAGVLEAKRAFVKKGKSRQVPKNLNIETVDRHLAERLYQIMPFASLSDREKAGVSSTLYRFQTMKLDDTRQAILIAAPFLSSGSLAHAAEVIAQIERSPAWQSKNKNITPVAQKMTERARG